MTMSKQQVDAWMAGYVHAWTTNEPADIATLFAPDAEQHEWPYETHWTGRDAIIAGWQERGPWQSGGWTFDWSLLAISGDTFAIQGVGSYTELGRFQNLWTVTLDESGRCTVFRMWNNEI
jgi:hypothetical protein